MIIVFQFDSLFINWIDFVIFINGFMDQIVSDFESIDFYLMLMTENTFVTGIYIAVLFE